MAKLTPAERTALSGARYGHLVGAYYVRMRTRTDVVARLMAKGYVSKRAGWLLTKKGEAMRAQLIGETK
jgi:hypothetical protein